LSAVGIFNVRGLFCNPNNVQSYNCAKLMALNMKLRVIFIFFIAAILSACAPVVKKTATPPVKTPVIQPQAVNTVKKAAEKQQLKRPQKQPQKVLILLSNSSRSNRRIARHISDALGDRTIEITLSGQPAQDHAMVRDIKESDTAQIVAIGLKAAKSVKLITNKQIIFAQIVNYRDYDLISANIEGVSALPAPEKLFKDWKALSPHLSKVAVVVGGNLDHYLNRAKKAAKAQGIELLIDQVGSDKEFTYKSKNMRTDVKGQWILPDNRVLSGKALKEVMAYASRRGRQIVVFSPKLLSFGGLFYAVPDASAVADVILQRLKLTKNKENVQSDSVLPVMSHKMGINQNIARQFNLTIPPEYRKYINGE